MTLRPMISDIAPVSNEFPHFIATCFPEVLHEVNTCKAKDIIFEEKFIEKMTWWQFVLRGIRHSEISLSETKH